MSNTPHKPFDSSALLCLVLACLTLLTGCFSAAPIPTLPTDAPADFPLQRYQAVGTDQVLQVHSAKLEMHVFRGGRLKHLGHNHIITSNALTGLIRRSSSAQAATSYADLYLPLASLVVDDPTARAAAGEAFSSKPSDADRRGTLGNMLGPRLLDAENHPYLQAQVRLLNPELAALTLRVKDQAFELQVPVTLELGPQSLKLASKFELTHAQIGLQPFTALGGAIAVADPIGVHLTIEASAR